MSRAVALLGATGFVGSAVRLALARGDRQVRPVRAPRLVTTCRTVPNLVAEAGSSAEVDRLADELAGAEVVVNAAGDPDASSQRRQALLAANALLPRVVLEAAARAGVSRMIHVSSAVVQGNRDILDAGEEMSPFSPYSMSKVLGEQVVRTQVPDQVSVTSYRPPSVHAPGRRVTRRVAQIAASRLTSVAWPGTQNSPQALLPNVAAAVAFLATCGQQPPEIVLHPWEGISAAALLTILGNGRRPVLVPRSWACAAIAAGRLVGHLAPSVAANTRRIEVLWLGQSQARSWLEDQGWRPPVGLDGWHQLAASHRPPDKAAWTSAREGDRSGGRASHTIDG